MIQIWCDGGTRGNGKSVNVGGWGAVVKCETTGTIIKGATKNTTNQRMELQACISALMTTLEEYDLQEVQIHSDSAYLVNCFKDKWYVNWERNGWLNSKKQPVENPDLWKQLLALVRRFPKVEFIKVKGHSGEEGNEIADKLANEAMDSIS